ncbi:MAG: adenylate/guanylate cyclase domain-containing protein [Actinomycetota bacterium]
MDQAATRTELPTGTVTFLFTDIEGSTKLVQRLGAEFRGVLEEHNRILRDAIRGAGGIDRGTEGDAIFAVFTTADAAVGAAVKAQRALAEHRWPEGVVVRVRMGLHTGEGIAGGDDYVGLDVHRAARISAAGHGGQIVVSRATAALVEGSLPEGVSLRELGPHRLKDLPDPERISQVLVPGLPQGFPPLRSLEVATNLPSFPTTFVGRHDDLSGLRERLEGARLVTITGPGGTGKTRLTVEVARSVAERYADGVTFADLSATTDPALVCHVIAEALAMRPAGTEPVWDAIAESLRDRTALLVLDNFEQVLPAATDLAGVIERAPGITVMVTSREALGIRGEHLFPLKPLGTGEGPSEAVALFVDRVHAVEPSFEPDEVTLATVAEICRRLDGMPLAIELAASRMRALSADELLARLDKRLPLLTTGPRDAPDRQRTLRGAIEWSHDLLDERERILFRRLGVFAGGFILAILDSICDPEGELGELLDLTSSLVQKSLVQRDPGSGRYSMYETIREFALERAEEAGEYEALRGRNTDQAVRRTEEAEPHLIGEDRRRWVVLLDDNHENLRSALEWTVQRDLGEAGMRIVAAVWRFWQYRGHLAEGRGWAEQVVALPSAQARTTHRARALLAASGIAYWQGDYDAMGSFVEESLDIARELGDDGAIGEALYNMSFVAQIARGDWEACARYLDEAEAYFERLDDRGALGRVAMARSFIGNTQGNFESTRAYAEKALEYLRDSGDRETYAQAMGSVALANMELGEFEAAFDTMQEVLRMTLDSLNTTGFLMGFYFLSTLANAKGDHERSARLWGAAEGLEQRLQAHVPRTLFSYYSGPSEEDLPRERAEPLKAEGRAMSLEDAIAYAQSED